MLGATEARAGNREKGGGDLLSILLSLVCLVHCLAAPTAVAALSLSGTWAQTEGLHWSLAIVAATLSGWTLLPRRGRGLSRTMGMLAVIGTGLLFLGAAEIPSPEWGTPATVAGGLALVLAHGLNWRRRRKAGCGAD